MNGRASSGERPWSLRVVAGGVPSQAHVAALTAAIMATLESEAPPSSDPTPAAYRSRWRRAALVETSEVPAHVKDGGPAWGAH